MKNDAKLFNNHGRLPRITIENHAAFGRLIKKWSKTPTSAPRDLDDLKKQAGAAGVGLTIPDRITKIEFIPQEEDTFRILIPLLKMVEDSEAWIQNSDNGYPLPEFYSRLAFDHDPELEDDDRLEFHAARIGDYSTGQCG